MHVHFNEVGGLGQGGNCPCNACHKDSAIEEIDAIHPPTAPYANPYEEADQEDLEAEGGDNAIEEESVAGLSGMGRKLFKIVDGSGREIARIRGKVVRTAEGYKALLENGQVVKLVGESKSFNIPDPYEDMPEDEDDEDTDDSMSVRPRNDLNDVFNDDLEIF